MNECSIFEKTSLQKSLTRKILLAGAFIRKDMCICVSYKLQFLFQFLQVFFGVAVVYYIGKMLGEETSSGLLHRYGGDYFAFALVGLAANSYLQGGLVTVTNNIRQIMNQGTLEAMCVTPIQYTHLLFYGTLWQFLYESLRIVFYFVLGVTFFGLRLPTINWAGVLLGLILTAPIFLMLGILSCAVLIVVKRGDPVNWIFVQLGALLAGTMFPIEVLPGWLRMISIYMPLTHALEVFRRCVLTGATIREVQSHFLALVLFVVVLLPTTTFVCQFCMRQAKKQGALASH